MKKASQMRLRHENEILKYCLKDIETALIKACEYLDEHGLIMSSPYENDDGVTSWYQYFLDEARKENPK